MSQRRGIGPWPIVMFAAAGVCVLCAFVIPREMVKRVSFNSIVNNAMKMQVPPELEAAATVESAFWIASVVFAVMGVITLATTAKQIEPYPRRGGGGPRRPGRPQHTQPYYPPQPQYPPPPGYPYPYQQQPPPPQHPTYPHPPAGVPSRRRRSR